jgi:hypothetical protein
VGVVGMGEARRHTWFRPKQGRVPSFSQLQRRRVPIDDGGSESNLKCSVAMRQRHALAYLGGPVPARSDFVRDKEVGGRIQLACHCLCSPCPVVFGSCCRGRKALVVAEHLSNWTKWNRRMGSIYRSVHERMEWNGTERDQYAYTMCLAFQRMA